MDAAPGKRPLTRNPFFWGAIVGIVVVTATRSSFRKIPEPPPVIGRLPAFQLTDEEGRAFGSPELAGKVWVASFFFTSCTTMCPRLMGQLKKLEAKYAEWKTPIEIVSITVDPGTDTPEKLKQYKERLGAGPRWHFLTAPEADMHALVEKGFLLYVGPKETDPASGAMDIAHSGRLMIVDGALGLRGAYESTDLGIEEVFHRSQHVHLNAR